MKHLAPVVCAGVMVLSSVAQAQTTFAQTQGSGGPSYASPAGRSPTTPGVATPTTRSGAVQPSGARGTTPGPSASEFGTQVPGVTTR